MAAKLNRVLARVVVGPCPRPQFGKAKHVNVSDFARPFGDGHRGRRRSRRYDNDRRDGSHAR